MKVERLLTYFGFSLSKHVPCAILLFLFFSQGCQTGTTKSPTNELIREENRKVSAELNRVVAKVNGVGITQRLLNRQMAMVGPKMVPHRSMEERKKEEIRKKALNELIEFEMMYQDGTAMGLKVNKDVFVGTVRQMRKALPSDVTLENVLAKKGHDLDWLWESIRKPELVINLKEMMMSKFKKDAENTVTDEFVLKYYNENEDRFREPEKYRLQGILIKVDPGSMKAGWKKGRESAEWIIQRLKKGDDFVSLAKEFSGDEYAEKGGDLGVVTKANLNPMVAKLLKKMVPGEIGGPARTMYGFHVIKLKERISAKTKKYIDIKDLLVKSLIRFEKDRLWGEWLKSLKRKYPVELVENEQGI